MVNAALSNRPFNEASTAKKIFYRYLPFSDKLFSMRVSIVINNAVHRLLCALVAAVIFAVPITTWAQATVIYTDDFEGAVTGWSNNSTDFDADVTTFLGRFDNNPTTTSRTFAIPAGSDSVEIEFDFYRFDSWDNNATWGFDRWQIEVDGTQLFSLPFDTNQAARNGVTGNVTWSITPIAPASHLAFNMSNRPWYQDQLHRVTLTIDAPSTSLTLLLRTALNQGGNDESGGYDNFTVTAFSPEPDIDITKTVEMAVAGEYNLPGNDVRYEFSLTSNGAAIDAGSIVLMDKLPPEVSLFTGDLNGSGQPVDFTDSSTPASGLSCCTAANIEFSDTTSGAPVFGYIPATPYDPDVTYIRITPTGGIRDAATDPVDLEFGIQARIE